MNEEYFSLEEDSINYKAVIYKLLSNWYWFVICGILGLAISYFITKHTLPSYQVSSSLVLSEEKNVGSANQIFEELSLGGKQNIENQIGILKSYTIIESTLCNLDWRISLYEKLFIGKRDLYLARPLFLKLDATAVNLEDCEIKITPLGDKYNLHIETINPKTLQVLEINTDYEYSKIFKSEFFTFTILKQSNLLAETYVFVINNLQTQTLNFKRRLNVEKQNKKADIISLSMTSTCVARDVDFLNKLSSTYISSGLRDKNLTSKNTVYFIDSQLEGLSDSLKHTGKKFTDFRSKNRTLNISMQADMIVEKVKEIEKQRAKVEMAYEYYKNLQAYIGDAKLMESIIAPSVVGVLDLGLTSMLSRLSILYGEKSRMEMIAMPHNPSLILLNKDIENILVALEENLRNLVGNTKSEIRRLKNRAQDIDMQLTTLPSMEQKLISIKRRFDLNNEIYNFLLKKRSEAAISMAANVSDAKRLDIARIKTSIYKGPKKTFNYLIGFFLGLMIPAVLLFIQDFLNDSIETQDYIESNSKLRLMGNIMRNTSDSELPAVECVRSSITESFRSLRTNIHYLFENTDNKVVAIHSAVPGEGKTFIALNLACVLASTSKKTLIIGADLRKAHLLDMLDDKGSMGLSKLLSGNYKIEDVIVDTQHENLDFLPSGYAPLNPAELLQSDAFKEMLVCLRNMYDYIVIDNAPVSLVTDGFIVSSSSDLNLFVIRQKYSSKENLKFINSIESQKQMRNIALVFNDVKLGSLSYKYSYYNYSSTYYGDNEDNKFSVSKLFKRKKM